MVLLSVTVNQGATVFPISRNLILHQHFTIHHKRIRDSGFYTHSNLSATEQNAMYPQFCVRAVFFVFSAGRSQLHRHRHIGYYAKSQCDKHPFSLLLFCVHQQYVLMQLNSQYSCAHAHIFVSIIRQGLRFHFQTAVKISNLC